MTAVASAPREEPVVEIHDPADERLRDYTHLTDVALRRVREPAEGLYIAESSTVIRRALAAGHRPRSFLMAPRWLPESGDLVAAAEEHAVPLFVAPEDVLRGLTGFHLHRGALASMHRPALRHPAELLRGARRVVVLEDVVDHTNVECSEIQRVGRRSRIAVFDSLVDHTNLGAAFRSAAALGVDAVLVTPSCADPLYRRSIRVSMGTVFQVPWTRIEPWPAGIDLLRDAGYLVAGMTLERGSITLDELVAEDHRNLALVFGTEGHGLAPSVVRRLDRKVTIPMMGAVDSLNVAASAAVAFYATRWPS